MSVFLPAISRVGRAEEVVAEPTEEREEEEGRRREEGREGEEGGEREEEGGGREEEGGSTELKKTKKKPNFLTAVIV